MMTETLEDNIIITKRKRSAMRRGGHGDGGEIRIRKKKQPRFCIHTIKRDTVIYYTSRM